MYYFCIFLFNNERVIRVFCLELHYILKCVMFLKKKKKGKLKVSSSLKTNDAKSHCSKMLPEIKMALS